MKRPRIETTVVGSYPLPDWLAATLSEQARPIRRTRPTS